MDFMPHGATLARRGAAILSLNIILTMAFAAAPVAVTAAPVWLAAVETGAGGDRSLVAIRRDGGRADRFAPRVTLDGSGGAAVVWIRRNPGRREILLSRFDGSSWTPPAVVTSSARSLTHPSVAFDAAGDLWIAWAAFQGTSDDIKVARWADGRVAETRVFGTAEYPDIRPSLAPDGQGGLTLTWQGYDGTRYRFLTSSFDGRAWTVPTVKAEGDSSRSINSGLIARRLLSEDAPLEELMTEAAPRLAPDVVPGAAWTEGGHARSALVPADDAAEVEAAPPAEAKVVLSPYDRTFIMGLGDSVTWGKGSITGGPATSYPVRLQGLLKGPWFTVNKGVPGDTSVEVLDRVDAALDERPSGLVILMIGINDSLFHSAETIMTNIDLIVGKIRDRGGKVLLSTTTPVVPSMRPVQYDTLETLNILIYDYAVDNAVPLIDMWNIFHSQSGWEDDLMEHISGNHPNDDGHALLALSMKRRLAGSRLLLGDLRWKAVGLPRPGQFTPEANAGTPVYLDDTVTPLAGNNIREVCALDLDGDGVDEVGALVRRGGAVTLTFYRTPAAGTTGSSALIAAVVPVANASWIRLGDKITHLFGIDVDGDGKDEIGLVKSNDYTGIQTLQIWKAHQPDGRPAARLVVDRWTIPVEGRVKDITAIQADGDAAEEILVLAETFMSREESLLVYDTPPVGATTPAANNEALLYRNDATVGGHLAQVAAADISEPPDGIDEVLILRTETAGGLDTLEAWALPPLPAAENTPMTQLAADQWARTGSCSGYRMETVRLGDGAGGTVTSLGLWLNP
jgi:lysophospholipase L1-like esterase